MIIMAIDGACRRNGKPDCVSAGGVIVQGDNLSETISIYEYNSTNQRGEMLALIMALKYIITADHSEAIIVTDSEYLFNAMTRGWYVAWRNSNWLKSDGAPVKNKDLWQAISIYMEQLVDSNREAHFYHIKGHCIPFGRVTANNLLARDNTGAELCKAVRAKYDTAIKHNIKQSAQDLSKNNNGYALPDETFKGFVVLNTVADAVATRAVDEADNSRKK